MTSQEDPRWSSEIRSKIESEMNGLIHEIQDVLHRRSENGQWLPPGEINEVGDNVALAKAAKTWVLDRLTERIDRIRGALDEIERNAAQYTGVVPPDSPLPRPAAEEVVYAMDDLVREITVLMQKSTTEDGKWRPPGDVRRQSPETELLRAARAWLLPQLHEHVDHADKVLSHWESRITPES